MKIERIIIENYINKPEIKLYKNPNFKQIKFLLEKYNELRGVIDFNKDLYVWSSYDVTHFDVIKNIDFITKDNEFFYIKNINTEYCLYIYNLSIKNRIKNHPKIIKAFKDISIKLIE